MVGEEEEDGRGVGVDETSEEEQELGKSDSVWFGLVCTADPFYRLIYQATIDDLFRPSAFACRRPPVSHVKDS